MTDSRMTKLLTMLTTIVVLLMLAITGLFLRMTQLQKSVLATLGSLQTAGSASQSPRAYGLDIGTVAPAFELPNLEDENVQLQDLVQDHTLLVFSAPSCPACREMYPHLGTLSKNDESIQILMISRGSVDESQQLAHDYGFSFPILIWDDEMAAEYKVPGTPYFYLLDGNRVIENKGFANTPDQLRILATPASH